MRIHNNIMAMFAHRQVGLHQSALSKALQRLSSGYRINSAADDPAGLGISERMRAQITAMNRAALNARDGISMVNTAEGALTEVHSMLNRMVELATAAANGTIQDSDREKQQREIDALLEEIERIGGATRFGSLELLNGKAGEGSGTVKLFVGDSNADHNWIQVELPNLADVMKELDGLMISDQDSAAAALERVKKAVGMVSVARGQLGATSNRLEYTVRSLENTAMNLTEAESRIRDADMAKEMMTFVREQVLAQASMLMMAHAMQEPYRILQLLR